MFQILQMANRAQNEEEDTRKLVVAITDFLRDQLMMRTDLDTEDRDCLEIAIECLQAAFELDGNDNFQPRVSRPLLDMFSQVANPVSVRDKIRAEAFKVEGNNFLRRCMYSEAESQYTNAIELDRYNAIFYYNRATARNKQSNFFEAIADCRYALLLNPDYDKAYGRMGEAYALMRRPREAARCFRQALELDPDNETYRNNLGVAESEIERPDEAQMVAALLDALFGGASPTSNDGDDTTQLPLGFLIVTESHPAIQEDPPQTSTGTEEAQSNAQSTQQHENAQARKRSQNGTTTISEVGGFRFPQPFGIVDEGGEEKPIMQVNSSLDKIENVNDGITSCSCEKRQNEHKGTCKDQHTEQNTDNSAAPTSTKITGKERTKSKDDVSILRDSTNDENDQRRRRSGSDSDLTTLSNERLDMPASEDKERKEKEAKKAKGEKDRKNSKDTN